MKQHGDEECPLRARANINVTQVDEDILAQLLRQSPTVNATFDELDLPSPADDDQDDTKRWHATLAYAKYQGLRPQDVSWEEVRDSSAGVDGWLNHFSPDRDLPAADPEDAPRSQRSQGQYAVVQRC